MKFMNKIGIVVPFYNKWQLTHQCLMSLHKHIPPDNVEIILINDASTDQEIAGGVHFWQKKVQNHKIRYKKNEDNLGFGGSMNLGAKIAMKYDADILVFLSNDVSVYGDFTKELLSTFVENGENILIGGEVINYPAGWNEIEIGGKKSFVVYPNGWFISCKSEVWERLGGFDPRYGKYDYEDVDLGTTAIQEGCSIIALNSQLIEHRHQGSSIEALKVDRMAHTKKNREVYLAKWADKFSEILERLEDVRSGA